MSDFCGALPFDARRIDVECLSPNLTFPMSDLVAAFTKHEAGEEFRAVLPQTCKERMFAATSNGMRALFAESFRGCGSSVTRAPYRITRIRPNTHLILYTEGGEGWLRCVGRTSRLLPGSVMILPARIRHDYGAVDRWEILWFHLGRLPQWNDFIPKEPAIREASQRDRMRTVSEEFLLELAQNDPADNLELLREFAKVLRLLIRRELRGRTPALPPPVGPHERLAQLWTLVEEQPAAEWTVGRLASEAGFSRSHLQFLAKRLYGVSAMEKVSQLRMQRASQLLHDPGAKVTAIAAELGYESPYAFSRAFKRIVGVSPQQFRTTRGIPARNGAAQYPR